jgi:tetratricopeptide (TPR) repeat protein
MRLAPSLIAALFGAATSLAWGATAVPPGPDVQVVDVLPQVTTQRPAQRAAAPAAPATAPPEPAQANRLAREAIGTARRTGDARYWGRAQTALGRWWDHPQAPPELMVLQATVLQGQHNFAAAQRRLRQALQADAQQPQAWLTLATLLKLDGRYADALTACDNVTQSGAAFYGRVCATEVRSLQGTETGPAWPALLTQTPQPETRAWLLSLWGEHLERRGQPAEALMRYQQSLALQPDLYTTLVQADLLLHQRRAADALVALEAAPDTDAVLLRRAHAQRRLDQPGWRATFTELRSRQQALERRGETLDAHARELGLMALWLQDDAPLAWRWAQRNLVLQQEPIDWWLALTSARQAGDREAFDQLVQRVRALGLTDMRLPLEWSHAS